MRDPRATTVCVGVPRWESLHRASVVMFRRATLTGLGALGTASAGAAYLYRPQPWKRPPEDSLSERPNEEENILMKSARIFTFVTGTTAFSFLMHVLNSFELKEDEHYTAFLEAVEARPIGVPLLTVSNHCSPLDDPGVLVGMLPARTTVRPKLMRWTICAQEICFKWKVAQAGLGSAKVLPIARGEGIDQRMFLNFYRRMLSGSWCHIFPEGHCEQDGALGGRAPGSSRDKHGRLKWGIGKLIAHAAVPPVVIPLFHTGMANVMPLNPFTRKILHTVPRTGNKITARAGAAICFEDLLEEHIRQHGPLRTLMASSALPSSLPDGKQGEGGGRSAGEKGRIVDVPVGDTGDEMWRSTPEERKLYSKIARRIEGALLELEAEARRDLGEDYPGLPAEPAAILRIGQAEGGGGK